MLARGLLGAAVVALCACATEVARGQGAEQSQVARSIQPPRGAVEAVPVAEASAESGQSDQPGQSPSRASPSLPEPQPPEPEQFQAQQGAPGQPPPLVVPVPVEDPSGRALDAFHAALRRAAQGEGQARVLFYGASHVASDLFTGPLRARLQQRFGNAGPGFVLPAKPWRWYRHSSFQIARSRGWRDARVKARAPRDDIYGLMGVALDIRRRFAVAAVEPRDAVPPGQNALYELWYLKQPNGGRLSVFIDGKRAGKINTRAARSEPGYRLFEAGAGEHRVELRAHGDGPVRIFGLSVERPSPGVVLDTLGIPGARARYHLHWDDAVYREQLARRQPDLVVLAYGTNEAGDDDVPIESYEQRLERVLARIRETVPNASCLLIGPSDRPLRVEDGSTIVYEPRPRTAQLVDAQRRAAASHGCGFFDLVAFMGGELSMVRWVNADPPLGTPDHVHFTRLGYERLGEVLHDALLAGFEAPSSLTASAEGAPQTP